jgi:hypothetical protein
MLIEFGALDEGAAWLNNSARVVTRGQQVARDMNSSIAGSRRARLRQLPRLSEHNVPHRQPPKAWRIWCAATGFGASRFR